MKQINQKTTTYTNNQLFAVLKIEIS